MKVPTVYHDRDIRNTMEIINAAGIGIAFILDDNDRLIGVITDGDIRRALLKGISIHEKVSNIMNSKPLKIYDFWSKEEIDEFLNSSEVKKKIPKFHPLFVPIVSRDEHILDVKTIYRENVRGNIILSHYVKASWLPKKVLVIGGAGYIGSVLVRELLKEGYHVKVMDSLLQGDHGIKELYEHDNFEFVKGDLTNIYDALDAMKDVDAIVHLAGIVGDPASKLNPKDTLAINYFSTRSLADMAKYLGISKFIFASSCSVYGFREDTCTEETETNPLSLYAETKIMSEQALLESAGNGFCPVILRFATAYGLSYRMRFDLVVNLLIAKAVVDKIITVYGEGKQYRPFVHIRDISQAILKILKAPPEKVCGEIFNVGSDAQNISIKELAEMIHEEIPDAELKFIKEKEDNRSYIVSFKKIREVLDFSAQYTIKDAIHEIKNAIETKVIGNYRDKIYSNYKVINED